MLTRMQIKRTKIQTIRYLENRNFCYCFLQLESEQSQDKHNGSKLCWLKPSLLERDLQRFQLEIVNSFVRSFVYLFLNNEFYAEMAAI